MGWEDEADKLGIPKSTPNEVPNEQSATSGWERHADSLGIPGAPEKPAESPGLVSQIGSGLKEIGKGALGTLSNWAGGVNTLSGEALPVDIIDRGGSKAPTTAKVPLSGLTDPSKRREIERGLSDATTFGLAEKAGNAVSDLVTPNLSLSDVTAGKHRQTLASTAEQDAQNAPGYREAGGAAGMLLPDITAVAGVGKKVIGALAKDGEKAVVNNRIAEIVGGGHGNPRAVYSERKALVRAEPAVKEVLASPAGADIAKHAAHDPSEGARVAGDWIAKVSESRPADYATVDKYTRGWDPQAVHDEIVSMEHSIKGAGFGDKKKALRDLAHDIDDGYLEGVNSRNKNHAVNVEPDTGGVAAESVGGEKTAALSEPNFTPTRANAGSPEAGYSQLGGEVTPTSENATVKIATDHVAPGNLPTVELRDYATRLVKKTNDAAENEMNKYKESVIKDILNRHLDVAAAHHPDAAGAVTRIREMNKQVMALKRIQSTLIDRAERKAANGLASAGLGAIVGGATGHGGHGDILDRIAGAAEGAATGYLTHRVALPIAQKAARGIRPALGALAKSGALEAAKDTARVVSVGKDDDK